MYLLWTTWQSSKGSKALQDSEVVRALISLFKAFAEREKSKTLSKAVDPTQLRLATWKATSSQLVCCFNEPSYTL